jgi:hypothetical protein
MPAEKTDLLRGTVPKEIASAGSGAFPVSTEKGFDA